LCRQRKIAEVVAMSAGANLKAYNSLWQLRNDTWSSLEESAIQLARAEAQQRPVEKLVETVTELLDILGPIERFWAFPGAQAYREARRLFAADNYDRLAALVTKANRALVTESYLQAKAGTQASGTTHTITRPVRRRRPGRTVPTSRFSSSRT
jgi:arginine decarboxylase